MATLSEDRLVEIEKLAGDKAKSDEDNRNLRTKNVVLNEDKCKLTEDIKKLLQENTRLLNALEAEQK